MVNQTLVILGILLLIVGIGLVIYGQEKLREKFDPIIPLSSENDAIYANVNASKYPPSCQQVINLMKYANNDDTIVQLLQDGTYYENSLKCYQDVAKAKGLKGPDFYNYCMAGKTGLPQASILCETAGYNQNCNDPLYI